MKDSTVKCFSKVIMLVYVPSKEHFKCLLVCIVTNTRRFHSLILQIWWVRAILLWLHFHSEFHGEFEHPFICLLISSSVIACILCPFLNWILLSFPYWFLGILYIFWVLTLCQLSVIYVENIFSHSSAGFSLCSFCFFIMPKF